MFLARKRKPLRTIIFSVPVVNQNGTFIYGTKQKPERKTFRSNTLLDSAQAHCSHFAQKTVWCCRRITVRPSLNSKAHLAQVDRYTC